jgi:hypothetical protein
VPAPRCHCGPESQRGRKSGHYADPKFLERLPPCNGSGQVFGEFINVVIHSFPFNCYFVGLVEEFSVQPTCPIVCGLTLFGFPGR